MKNYFHLLILLCCCKSVFAQTDYALKQLRYEEDYKFLRDDTTRDWYRKIKFIPISKDRNSYISFGGEGRFQAFYVHNENWGDASKRSDAYFLNRWLAHSDLHVGSQLRFFVQMQSSLSYSRVNASPIDRNPLEIHQGFVDFSTKQDKKASFLLRIGRQEFLYGSQRLISVREGPNNRQSFDAVKGILRLHDQRLDIFYSHPVAAKSGLFDDSFNRKTKFWGLYYQLNDVPLIKNIDLYYLGLRKLTAVFNDGRGEESRHSVGTRVWYITNNWQYDLEALYQFGRLEEKSIHAWTASINAAYQISHVKTKPKLGLKTELISGDRVYGDDKVQTFNPLFPRGAYFGLAALIGPVNLIDIHPNLYFSPANRIGVNVDYDVFWRFSRSDGLYAVNTSLIYSGNTAQSNSIGKQLAFDLSYKASQFLNFTAEFTWFEAGPYLKEVGAGRNIIFTGLTAQLKL